MRCQLNAQTTIILYSLKHKIWCVSFNDKHQHIDVFKELNLWIDVFVNHGWLGLSADLPAGTGEWMYKTSDALILCLLFDAWALNTLDILDVYH